MSLVRVVSPLVAWPRDPSSSQTGGFLLHHRKGFIHPPLVTVNDASTIIPASFINRASATGILREPSRALPEEDKGKGDRPTSPHTCMSLSQVAGFNRLWIHSRFNTGTLTCCCSGMTRSSCGVARRFLFVRLVIVDAW
ncbi:hypothetical protein TcCL_NonESM12347 [Trypanosoma cruzi]|nr:hypothetical protein TcCL_NonESM12347 [Trypanosoma cruzi]